MAKTTSNQKILGYNFGAISFHWLIALLILLLLVMGFVMQRVPEIPNSLRFSLIQWHKTLGLLVLGLTLGRIVWRFLNKPPKHAPMLKIELFTANTIVVLFYILTIVVPLTGWIVISASSTGIPTFFLRIQQLVWPNLPVPADHVFEQNVYKVHMILAYSFIIFVGLHVGGAFKHVLFDHVPELSRMLPNHKLERKPSSVFSRYMTLGIIAVFFVGGLALGQLQTYVKSKTSAASTSALATSNSALAASSTIQSNWTIDYSKSALGYNMTFSGTENKGSVEKWQGAIRFDPNDLAGSIAEITLDSSSITYADAYVQGSIKDPDGLDSANFPQITVKLDKFTKKGNDFAATGTMTIKGITLPITVPFTFEKVGTVAHVKGKTKIERLSFNIGKVNDSSAQWLGSDINIVFDVVAEEQPN